jgi:hypothetical protein
MSAGKRCDTPVATVADVPARLVDLNGAARYLGGVSPWTVRALIADGHLRPVPLPSVRHRGETGRRILIDRADLDLVIEKWKAAGR